MFSSGRTCSMAPVLMASFGMPKMIADWADSAMVRPPRSRTLRIDSEPSSPMPVMITATRRSPQQSEAVEKRRSTGGAEGAGGLGGDDGGGGGASGGGQ